MTLTIEQEKKLSRWLSTNKDEYEILDFTDWRVVGRLIEKMHEQGCNLTLFQGGGCRLFDLKNLIEIVIYESATPQEAVVMAVLAYIESEE